MTNSKKALPWHFAQVPLRVHSKGLHTFSAFWLWSSVVSVLISVTTDILPTGRLLVTPIFLWGGCSLSLLEGISCVALALHLVRCGTPLGVISCSWGYMCICIYYICVWVLTVLIAHAAPAPFALPAACPSCVPQPSIYNQCSKALFWGVSDVFCNCIQQRMTEADVSQCHSYTCANHVIFICSFLLFVHLCLFIQTVLEFRR